MKMKFLLIFLALYTVSGCVTTGPASKEEAFPVRNQDPTLGVFIIEGNAHLNLFIYDSVGRLLEQIYVKGGGYVTINNQYPTRHLIRRLDVGRYRIEVYPFYYMNQLIPPSRYRVDLQRQTYYLSVDRNPADHYYAGRHWGWTLRINVGNIPQNATPIPMPQIDIRANFM